MVVSELYPTKEALDAAGTGAQEAMREIVRAARRAAPHALNGDTVWPKRARRSGARRESLRMNSRQLNIALAVAAALLLLVGGPWLFSQMKSLPGTGELAAVPVSAS